jgi:AraC-like DNA-binding protein
MTRPPTRPSLTGMGATVVPASPAPLPALGFDRWREAVSQAFVPLEAETVGGTGFNGHLAAASLGELELSTVGGAPVRVRRTPATIRSADRGYLKVGVQTRGYCVLTQDGREAALTPGDLAVYDTTRPYELVFDRDFQMLVLMLPRDLLVNRTRSLPELTARRISGRSGMGAVLSPFLAQLGQRLLLGDLEPSIEICDAVLDLLSATCRAEGERDGAVPASAQQALLLRVQSHIDERLGDTGLDPETVAAAHHVSVRYLQKLFQAEGTTVSAWIRRRRLEQCLRDLRDERLRDAPAAAIGARWGFPEPANFSRAFRREFGTPPSAVRPA